jgi:hypothetical protein
MASDISTAPSPRHRDTIEPPNFWTVLDKTHVQAPQRLESDEDEALDGSRKRKKRRTAGVQQFTCKICTKWSILSRYNASIHVRNFHPIKWGSVSSSIQPSVASIYAPRPSDDALRRIFNVQGYREALIGLLTRRRMPFSAVEWPELQNIVLAANPAIRDKLITSRRTALRHILVNYNLHCVQLRDRLQTAVSPIHISSDLWTSPHRHSLLAVCAQ